MGFWSNWKEKRKDEQKTPVTKTETKPKPKKEKVNASALEEAENQKYHQEIVENIDGEIKKTNQQKLDDLIEDPHIHSQGFISPKQGVHVFVDEVVDNSNLKLEKKKNLHETGN